MIKVVSSNVWCGGKDEKAVPLRAPRLKAVLDRLEPDLVGFQEVTPKWMPLLEEYYGEEYEIFNRYRKIDNQEGTPMMWKKSRFDCLDKGYFWLSDTPDIESGGWCTWGCYRICLWAKLWDKQEGNEILFFNTHYGFGDDNQVKSGRLILDHIRNLNGETVILTADFNMHPKSPGYKKLVEQLADANTTPLDGRPGTFHGYSGKPAVAHIDYCFVSPATLKPVDYQIITDPVDGLLPSDHYPVYVELEASKKLTLVTHNVRNNGEDPVERSRMLRSLLRKQKADIIGLQEVTPTFIERLEKMEQYNISLKYRTEDNLEATPIMWRKDRFDLVKEEFFWLSETPEVPGKGFGGKYPRIATLLVLQYKDSDKKICVLNTHFDFSSENHLASVKLINEKLAPYGDIPVFITADFNMRIGSPGYKAMREQYKDVRKEVAFNDFTPTTNSFGCDMCEPCIIDYVFTNGVAVTPISYKVLNEHPKGKYISDHYGITTTFKLD